MGPCEVYIPTIGGRSNLHGNYWSWFIGVLSKCTSLVKLTCKFKTPTIGEGENVGLYAESHT
jgi:hypothetical protein